MTQELLVGLYQNLGHEVAFARVLKNAIDMLVCCSAAVIFGPAH